MSTLQERPGATGADDAADTKVDRSWRGIAKDDAEAVDEIHDAARVRFTGAEPLRSYSVLRTVQVASERDNKIRC